MNEQGSSKSTRIQVAGLWIPACSLALALLHTVFDVLEVMGWREENLANCTRQIWLGESALLVGADRLDYRGCTFRPVDAMGRAFRWASWPSSQSLA